MQRHVTFEIDAPAPAVLNAAREAFLSGAAQRAASDSATITTVFEDRDVMLTLAVEAAGDRSRVSIELTDHLHVPFFQWFFGPARRVELRRLLRHARHRLDAAVAGAPLPDPPSPLPITPPVAFGAEQTLLIATVCMASAVANFGSALFGQNVDPVARSFGVSNSDLGVSLAITRGGVLFALVASALADRRGRRTILLWCLAGVCVGNGVSALAPNIEIFTAAQLIVRASVNAVLVVGGIAVVEEAPEGARAFAVAMLGLASGAGFALAVILLPIADLGDNAWRAAFAVSAFSIALLPAIARRLAETTRFSRLARGPVQRGRLSEVFDRAHGRRFLLLAVIGLLANVLSAPSAQFMNRYLSDERGFSSSGIAVFRGVTAGIPGLVGILLGGRLAETRGRRPVAIVSLFLGSALTMVFFLGSGALLWITAAAAILAAAPAALALGTLDAELFPTEVRGTSNAFLLVASVIGSVAGLLIAGALSDPLGGLGYAIALCGIAPIVASVLLLPRLPESRGRALDDISPSEG